MTYQDTNTVRSYSGTRGCMCGCKGKYNVSTTARKRMYNKLLKDSDARLDVFRTADEDGTVGALYVNTDTRTNVVYLTAEGITSVLPLLTQDQIPYPTQMLLLDQY